MSKKSRKNPSKTATIKVAKSAAKAKVAKATKATAKATVKSATKSPAKTAIAKAAKTPAKKTVVKATVKPKVPAVKKSAAKPAVEKTTSTPAVKVAKSTTVPKPGHKRDSAPAVAVEGSMAPAFTLPRDGGATVALSDYAGRKLVIFFYPRANTPGCTKEAIDFTRLSADFEAAGTALLGVSADPLKAQENFRDKHDLAMPLLSDATQDMLRAYGAWGEKSMYGKVFEGVLRTTVLIDADGRAAKIWRSVKVDGHADAVLDEARRI